MLVKIKENLIKNIQVFQNPLVNEKIKHKKKLIEKFENLNQKI